MTYEQILELYTEQSAAKNIVAMWAAMVVSFRRSYGFEPKTHYDALCDAVDKMKLIDDQIGAYHADTSIDQAQYVGDSCGYLAAQCEARQRIGVEPTADQREAWEVCNPITSTQESF